MFLKVFLFSVIILELVPTSESCFGQTRRKKRKANDFNKDLFSSFSACVQGKIGGNVDLTLLFSKQFLSWKKVVCRKVDRNQQRENWNEKIDKYTDNLQLRFYAKACVKQYNSRHSNSAVRSNPRRLPFRVSRGRTRRNLPSAQFINPQDVQSITSHYVRCVHERSAAKKLNHTILLPTLENQIVSKSFPTGQDLTFAVLHRQDPDLKEIFNKCDYLRFQPDSMITLADNSQSNWSQWSPCRPVSSSPDSLRRGKQSRRKKCFERDSLHPISTFYRCDSGYMKEMRNCRTLYFH